MDIRNTREVTSALAIFMGLRRGMGEEFGSYVAPRYPHSIGELERKRSTKLVTQ